MESDKTLGIDLGTNSLGWAILDNITGDILDKGVLVFPEGIDPANDTQGGASRKAHEVPPEDAEVDSA